VLAFIIHSRGVAIEEEEGKNVSLVCAVQMSHCIVLLMHRAPGFDEMGREEKNASAFDHIRWERAS